MKRVALITAVVVAVLMLIFGILFGKVVEETLFLEILKYVFMYFPICVIFEVFAYVLCGTFYHGSRFDPDSEAYKKAQEKKK